MNRSPFFFQVEKRNLFGLLHYPERDNNGIGFVFCYPFAEERIRVHRVYYNFAKVLAKRGYTVLQFDYRGCGDSEGEWGDATIEDYIKDSHGAIDYLVNDKSIKSIVLFGTRLGATIASLTAETESCVNSLILWEPIISGKDYIYNKLRSNIAAQVSAYRKVIANRDVLINKLESGETVNIEGYELSKMLYSSIKRIDLLQENKTFTGKVVIAQTFRPKRELKVTADIEKLTASYNTIKSKVNLIAAHSETFWELLKNYYPRADDLFEKTLNVI